MNAVMNIPKLHPIRTRQYLFLILASIFTLPALIMLIALTLIVSLDSEEHSESLIPTYSADAISKICLALNIGLTDEFCADPSNQNPDSFESMLQRNYPTEETTYTELINVLNMFKSKPSSYCNRAEVEGYGIYALYNCPPPNQCGKGYTCTFDLTETVGALQVNISYPEGSITGYRVSRISDLDDSIP